MKDYSNLFVLQLIYEHYDEFKNENFTQAFNKYFKQARNKDLIKELINKYLFELKFTKEEIEKNILVMTKIMNPDQLAYNSIEWEEYELNNKNDKKGVKIKNDKRRIL